MIVSSKRSSEAMSIVHGFFEFDGKFVHEYSFAGPQDSCSQGMDVVVACLQQAQSESNRYLTDLIEKQKKASQADSGDLKRKQADPANCQLDINKRQRATDDV